MLKKVFLTKSSQENLLDMGFILVMLVNLLGYALHVRYCVPHGH